MNQALNGGYVVYVGPLAASFPLFTLLLSVIFFRQESFSSRMLAGLALILIGVLAIMILP
jgi:drug/metabolite transporter (DMT)-like permease